MTTTTKTECPKCNGWGSDLLDDAPTCRNCGGSGLVAEPMTTTEASLSDVCEALKAIGYDSAAVINTGGGCMGISVANGKALVGCSCGWGADLYGDDGEYEKSVNLDEILATDDATQIAATLHQAILAAHTGEGL